jgi:Myb-like DNA-binding domain
LQEDRKVIELVGKYGPKKWSAIAHELPGRIGKQCRERWHNHLNPDINKGNTYPPKINHP